MLTTQKDEARITLSHFNLAGYGSSKLEPTESRRVRLAILDSISRDIARPLALIAGAAAGLKNRNRSREASVHDELIDVIEGETECIERFVAILLDMAKLECDVIEAHKELLDLKDVVGVAVNEGAKALQDRKLDVSLSPDLPALRLDAAILRRVLLILIENAASQSPPGSTVGLHAGRDQTAVRIQILDEGDGIPTAILPRVFDQFHLPCTDEPGRDGAGMQLAVCRGYVETLGGEISGYNRTDRSGAVFTITLPISG